MAHLTIEFFSKSLIRPVTFQMYLPNDPRPEANLSDNPYYKRPTKVLFLLHGYTGAAGGWAIEHLADRYNFAMVMPNGENAFFLDGNATGAKYATFLGQELVEYIRKTFHIGLKPEDTGIAGLSMGGFGAIHTGLAYPENFGHIGAMSSALIVHGIAGMKPGTDNGVANYDYYRNCFGDLDQVLESEANPEVLVRKLKTNGTKLPEIYMCCGTEDFLLEPNRQFHAFLEQEQVAHTYIESKGQHDGIFWGEYTPKIAEWMFADCEEA